MSKTALCARSFALSAALVVFGLTGSVSAHQGPQSYCTVTTVPGGIDVVVETPVEHVAELLESSSNATSEAELLHAAAFVPKLEAQVTARTPAGPCRVDADEPRILDRDVRSVSVQLHFYCGPGSVTLRNAWWLDVNPTSQTLCAIDGAGFIFQRGMEEHDVGVPPSVATILRSFMLLGMKHVASGVDHLCFVIALLVRAAFDSRERSLPSQLRAVAGLVTAFTVGHSITLVAAGLGVLTVNTRWVESLIAASLVFMGVENVVRERVHARWLVVSVFGLVHGLGFASALAETELPARSAVLALLCFNGGVELAQLSLVILVFPLLSFWAHRASYRRGALIPVSLLIAAAGLVWVLKRAAGVSFFPWLGS